MRWRNAIWLVAMLAGAFVCGLVAINPVAGGEAIAVTATAEVLTLAESKLLEITNSERARFGLPALVVDPGILESARSHATWMASRQSMTHSSGPFCENIAMGQGSPEEAMSAWMHSPGHRANLLRVSSRAVGVAVARSASGALYWCWQATGGDGGANVSVNVPNGGAYRYGHRRRR